MRHRFQNDDGRDRISNGWISPDYLTDLNKEQRRAVDGAGSGKTKTLAQRVAHLVVTGVDPHRILLLTFTRRAAEEMIRRVKRITTKALCTQQVDLPWSGTLAPQKERRAARISHWLCRASNVLQNQFTGTKPKSR